MAINSKAPERLITTKLRESTKKKLEIIKAVMKNDNDTSTQKIGRSDYELLKMLVDAEYLRLKDSITQMLNNADSQ